MLEEIKELKNKLQNTEKEINDNCQNLVNNANRMKKQKIQQSLPIQESSISVSSIDMENTPQRQLIGSSVKARRVNKSTSTTTSNTGNYHIEDEYFTSSCSD